MPKDERSDDGGGGVLAGLLAPLRLPERAVEALQELRPMRQELTRVREQTEPLADLLGALQSLEQELGTRLSAVHDVVTALESDESHLNLTTKELGAKVAVLSDVLTPVDDRLVSIERAIVALAKDVGTILETLVGVKADIQRITGLRGGRGLVERARDAVTGGNQEEDMAESEAPESEAGKVLGDSRSDS